MKRHLGANKMYNPLIKQIMNLFGNKETNQKSFDDGIEQIKADYAALKEEIVIKEEKIIEQQKIIEALREQLEKGNPDTTTPIVTVEETPAPKEEVTIQMPDYAPALEAIGNNVAALKAQADEIKMLVERREALDENMRAMHKELEQFRGDFYAKITQPHLLAMLDLHKRFFDTHAHFDHLDNTEADMQQLYNNLMNERFVEFNAEYAVVKVHRAGNFTGLLIYVNFCHVNLRYFVDLTACFTVTRPPLGPGTAPRIKRTLRSTSTLTITRFWMVTFS